MVESLSAPQVTYEDIKATRERPEQMLDISSDEDSAEYDKYPATVGVKVASREDMLAELDPRPKRGKKLFNPFKDSVGEMMVHPLSPLQKTH